MNQKQYVTALIGAVILAIAIGACSPSTDETQTGMAGAVGQSGVQKAYISSIQP